MSDPNTRRLRPWESLAPDEQLRLREAHGHFLDTLPPTFDLRTKEQRCRDWLTGQGVDWRPG